MQEKLQNSPSVLDRLRQSNNGLSAGRRRVVAYLVTSYKTAAFATAAQIARKVGVSEATVVRVAQAIGYPGFPGLQRELRMLVLQALTTLERLSGPQKSPDSRGGAGMLDAVVRQEMDNLSRLAQLNRRESLRQWVRVLRLARTVAVAGMQSSASLAQFFGFHLSKTRLGVSWFSAADIVAHHHVARMTRGDLLCVLAFPRYPRALVELAQFARERGLPVLVMTDSDTSPLAPLGTPTLYAPTASLSFVDGYAAPVCLINALMCDMARASLKKVRRSLAEYERAAERASVFLHP